MSKLKHGIILASAVSLLALSACGGGKTDATPAAAAAIGLTSRQGIARVKIERLR